MKNEDLLLRVAEALADYINSLERDVSNVEAFSFSMDIYRTGDKEFTFGHPVLTVSRYKREEDDNDGA